MAGSNHSDHPPFNHPAPLPLLIGVFLALVFLTILTLVTSNIELAQFAFAVAMLIATAKAALVCAFFMHMFWDKGFNILFFLSSTLFVSLFIGVTLLDTGAYKESIDLFPRAAEPAKAVAPESPAE
jgi:cytochrome c oxidase subunit 4